MLAAVFHSATVVKGSQDPQQNVLAAVFHSGTVVKGSKDPAAECTGRRVFHSGSKGRTELVTEYLVPSKWYNLTLS